MNYKYLFHISPRNLTYRSENTRLSLSFSPAPISKVMNLLIDADKDPEITEKNANYATYYIIQTVVSNTKRL